MQAARKPKEVLSLADLGIDPAPKVKRRGLHSPPPRSAGRILEGEIPDQVKELVDLLKNEAKAV
jgi:electron transfer flavoprotein beta subunit